MLEGVGAGPDGGLEGTVRPAREGGLCSGCGRGGAGLRLRWKV